MITLHGPIARFPSLATLRDVLATVPEVGEFTMGGVKVLATEQLRRFQEAGLRVPEWTKDNRIAHGWLNTGSTVLARREDHTQGRDIMIRNLMDTSTTRFRNRWNSQEWWCKFNPSTAEWRIHVFDGRVIGRGKKEYLPVHDLPETGEYHEYNHRVPELAIRSRSRGWRLRHDLEPTPALRDAAKAAVASLPGYLYGAVDLLDTPTGPVILEVNRLPAMDDYTRTRYVDAIRRHVAGRRVTRTPTAATRYEGVEVW